MASRLSSLTRIRTSVELIAHTVLPFLPCWVSITLDASTCTSIFFGPPRAAGVEKKQMRSSSQWKRSAVQALNQHSLCLGD